MSQQEFEQADRDVIAVVENHAHPDAKKAAEKICRGEPQEGPGSQKIATPVDAPRSESKISMLAGGKHTYAKCGLVRNDTKKSGGVSGDTEAAELRRQILLTAIQVLSCVLVAVLFVAALIDPSIVVFLVNVGVLVCGMVAAILVDRFIRIWRKG